MLLSLGKPVADVRPRSHLQACRDPLQAQRVFFPKPPRNPHILRVAFGSPPAVSTSSADANADNTGLIRVPYCPAINANLRRLRFERGDTDILRHAGKPDRVLSSKQLTEDSERGSHGRNRMAGALSQLRRPGVW